MCRLWSFVVCVCDADASRSFAARANLQSQIIVLNSELKTRMQDKNARDEKAGVWLNG
jgi:hypothetical protein